FSSLIHVLFSSHASSSLFFSTYVHLRSLHSFPTRRSSDLWFSAGTQLAIESDWGDPALEGIWLIPSSDADGVTQGEATRVTTTRSEEHTSELQSPDHLVCRLLLEKKK